MDDDSLKTYDDDYVLPASHSIIPPITSFVSIVGSYIILREVIHDHQRKRGKPVSRVLISMSVADIFFSMGLALSTFVAPSDLDYIMFNQGNQQTCELQGFLIQFGLVASPLFNTTLTYFYLLMIKHGWTDVKLKTLEVWFQCTLWLIAIVSAVFPVPLGLYNNACDICWLESYPEGCKDSFTYGDDATCTRGDNAWLYAVAFSIFPAWCCLVLSMALLVLIYLAVRANEDTGLKYASSLRILPAEDLAVGSSSRDLFANSSSSTVNVEAGDSLNTFEQRVSPSPTRPTVVERFADRTKSRAVAVQAVSYVTAFVVTHLCWTIAKIIWFTSKEWNEPFYVVAYNIMLPLQGFFNCLVFVRKRRDMKTPEGRLFRRCFCFCCERSAEGKELQQQSRKSSKKDSNSSGPLSGTKDGDSGRPEEYMTMTIKVEAQTDNNSK